MSAEPAPSGDERLEHALGLAYQYLNRRERTVAEMRRHLSTRDVDAATLDAVARTLTEQGYLDDVRFARLFAQDRRELEQWGSERIKQGLLGRGIDRELVEATLVAPDEQGGGPAASREDELGRALALLRRRFPVPPRGRPERDRALGVLLRKGYASEHAFEALALHARETADAHGPDPDEN